MDSTLAFIIALAVGIPAVALGVLVGYKMCFRENEFKLHHRDDRIAELEREIIEKDIEIDLLRKDVPFNDLNASFAESAEVLSREPTATV